MGCFWQVGVFNVIVGLWNTLTRKKHNQRHQKLNLLPFPALLSSPFDLALPHDSLSLSPSSRFFHLPFSLFPSLLWASSRSHFVVSSMWVEVQIKYWAKLQFSHHCTQGGWGNLKKIPVNIYTVHLSCLLCCFSQSFTFPLLPFFKNRQVTRKINVWINHPQHAVFSHSLLHYTSSESDGGCPICSVVHKIKAYLSCDAYIIMHLKQFCYFSPIFNLTVNPM